VLRRILKARTVIALAMATAIGWRGLDGYPIQFDNPFLALIAVEKPLVFQVLTYGYSTLWFTTSFFAASLMMSALAIVAYRYPQSTRMRHLPLYPCPDLRPTPSLVLGEAHFARTTGRAPRPTWLTTPQRGLYTGVMILGAVGTGKTSACMYPYVDQLLRWRPEDPRPRIGGLVLEMKGDFCHQVRQMLRDADRENDYIEIGLDTKVKASIIEGIVVFLSLFDEHPAVYRASCPPREAYITPPKPGDLQPLPPLEDLLETGHVLGLNFPVAMNPALARGLGVMLKLDFQRAVLQRIPKIAAHPEQNTGAICCSLPTSTTPLRPWVKRTRPATSAPLRCPVRRG
jgi:hypothetical protein